MTDLSARAVAEEQMDSAELPPGDYAALLADLARVNGWTMAARPTLAFLDRAIPRGGRLKLLDVGYGHGDMLRRIAAWAARRGVDAELVGIDLNPRSARGGAAMATDIRCCRSPFARATMPIARAKAGTSSPRAWSRTTWTMPS